MITKPSLVNGKHLLINSTTCIHSIHTISYLSLFYLNVKVQSRQSQRMCLILVQQMSIKEYWRWYVYLIEVGILGGSESKPVLLGLKCQEAGQQSLSYLQVIAIEAGGSLGNITELVSKLLLHNGVQLCLITLQGIKLYNKNREKNIEELSKQLLCGERNRNMWPNLFGRRTAQQDWWFPPVNIPYFVFNI